MIHIRKSYFAQNGPDRVSMQVSQSKKSKRPLSLPPPSQRENIAHVWIQQCAEWDRIDAGFRSKESSLWNDRPLLSSRSLILDRAVGRSNIFGLSAIINSTTKVLHPKYYEYLREADQHCHLGRWKNTKYEKSGIFSLLETAKSNFMFIDPKKLI